jgi:hypothetical protein
MPDRDDLRDVVTNIEKVMDNVVKARHILFPRKFRDRLKAAWDELKSDDPQDPNTLAGMKSSVDGASDDALRSAGASGKQLELKYFEFLDSYNDLDCKGGITRLKRFTKWAKLIVGSVSKIIPAFEILLEFIEAVELGIEKAEES